MFTQTANPIFLSALDPLPGRSIRLSSALRVSHQLYIKCKLLEKIVFTSLVVEGRQVISTDLSQ
jgi:hypothetical protein